MTPGRSRASPAEAGVPDADKWVDASTLATPEALKQAAMTYHVFGRVTPQQKRELVQALRLAGHTVAMTGDGVNDVLALRRGGLLGRHGLRLRRGAQRRRGRAR